MKRLVGIIVLLTSCSPIFFRNSTPGGGGGSPGPEHRIFVSSVAYDGNLGGLAGADTLCTTLAGLAGLIGSYMAVLSDSTTDASSRLSILGPVYNYSAPGTRLRVAANSAAFWGAGTTNLENMINYSETYTDQAGIAVWTSTTNTGLRFSGLPFDFCNDWTDNSGASQGGTTGMAGNTDGTWLDTGLVSVSSANNLIYCISQ